MAPLPRRTILVPALALAVLVGMVAGGVLIALDLAPRRHRVVYQTPTTVSSRMSLERAIPVGPSGTGEPQLDRVANFLREHGGDQITRTEGITSKAVTELSTHFRPASTAATPAR